MYGDDDRFGGPPAKRPHREDGADPINPDPSPVVHVRHLSPKATEADLIEALGTFGRIAYALVRRSNSMALVEFETLEGAKNCVKFASENQIYVAGAPANFNYSTSTNIQRMGHESATTNHVLVLTISNVAYPINVDVLYEICNPQGEVRKICIVKRTHVVVALVEFPSKEIATTVKHAINGADIYSGCCTLKVEYARADSVRVVRQDPDQRDYTNGAPVAELVSAPSQRKTLIGGPPADSAAPAASAFGAGDFRGAGYGAAGGYPPTPSAASSTRGGPPPPPPAGGSPYGSRSAYGSADPYAAAAAAGYPPSRDAAFGSTYDRYVADAAAAQYGYATGYMDDRGGLQGGEGCVMMVYGIEQEKLNCDKLFNVLCQYGNVLRIKFMRAKADTAMVEFGSSDQIHNALNFLQGMQIFGLTIELKTSFQAGIREVKDPFDMPDGTPSFRDYSASRNQRWTTPENAARNRPMKPQVLLHWFNAPPEMDQEKINELFTSRKAPAPKSVTVFPSRSERSSSGLAEFETVEHATEALALANHTPVMSSAGKTPYIVKLSFTFTRGPRGAGGDDDMDDSKPGFDASRGGYRGRGRGSFRGTRGDFRGGRGRGGL